MEKTSPLKRKKIRAIPSLVYLSFTFLALFSVLALDYISWEKGKKSYIFSPLLEEKVVIPSQDELKELILKSIDSFGVNPLTIQQYKDSKNILHIKVDLSLKKYDQLKNSLADRIKEINSSVQKKEEQETRDKRFYLWEIDARNKENLIILFSCSKEISEITEKSKDASPILHANRAAIIIDDMGYSLSVVKKISSINKHLTISVLPFSPYAQETAQVAYENGLEVMLHLPLQSVDSHGNDKYEAIILSGMSAEEVKEALARNLRQVPYIRGVNNHMGSRITADSIIMRIILEQLGEKNLFFVDSVTTGRSVAFRLAQEMRIPSARRHVFLDSENDEEYIKRKMIELFRYAQQHGSSIGICHPTDETIAALEKNIHLAEEYDIELVFVSQIVR